MALSGGESLRCLRALAPVYKPVDRLWIRQHLTLPRTLDNLPVARHSMALRRPQPGCFCVGSDFS